jgi:hypothetical protein
MLTEAAADVLALAAFPQSHWRRVWSTNPLERVNGEVKRRADVNGIFPNEAAIVRLVGADGDPRQVVDHRAALLLRGLDGRDLRGGSRGHRLGQAGLAGLLDDPHDHVHALRLTRPDLHRLAGHGRSR